MRLVLIVALLVVTSGAAAAHQQPGAAAFTNVCEPCHGPGGRGGAGPRLAPLPKEDEDVLAIVREGFGQMPPISSRELSDEQVREIVVYLKSLGSTPITSSRGPSTASATEDEQIVATVAVAERAARDKDIAALEGIYDDSLTYAEPDGNTLTKAARLKAVLAGRGIESNECGRATPRIYGDIALLKCGGRVQDSSGGRSADIDVDVLWVLIRSGASWRIVAHQATVVR